MSRVVVTGSTKGIGRGMAEEFVKRGHDVAVSSRSEDDAQRVAEELTVIGPGRACGTRCDVSRRDDVQGLWDFAASELGGVDLWINNAGYATARYSVEDLPENLVHTLIDSNFKGAVFGSQVAVAGFRAQGSGALYNTLGGSYDGKRLTPNMGVYSATKAAIWLMTRYLVSENQDSNVVIGTISPGMLITENWFAEQQELAPDEWEKLRPTLNVLCDHVDVATPWLVDEVLSNHETGKRIAWLSTGKIMRRFFDAKVLGRKRDLFSRYGLG